MTELDDEQPDRPGTSLPDWFLPAFSETTAALSVVGRRIGKLTLANLTAVLALSGLVLYAVGLLRRVAQLHAEGVPTTRGLPLASLQDYLVQGLSVVVDPNNVQAIGVVVAVAVAGLLSPRILAALRPFAEGAVDSHTSDTPNGSDGLVGSSLPTASPPKGIAYRVSRRALAVLAILIVRCVLVVPLLGLLLVPVAYWGPAVASFVPLAMFLWLNSHFKYVDFGSWRGWSQKQARLTITWLVITLLLLTGLYTYFDPPPLERATVRTLAMGTLRGKLLGESDGFLYLIAGHGSTGRQHGLVLLPTSTIVSVQIEPGEKRYVKTLLELSGWRAWRLEFEHESVQIVRSRPTR